MTRRQLWLEQALSAYAFSNVAHEKGTNADATRPPQFADWLEEEAKELYLEQALEAGFSSGVAEGDVVGRIRARHGLSAKES